MRATLLQPGSPDYPPALLRGGAGWTPVLHAFGSLALLRQPLTALFCSNKCPGEVILRAFDQVAQLRDAGTAVISGFHTPVEKECLAILLRGASPIVICPPRSLARFRVPSAWQPALTANRLLLLSPFADDETRATADLAAQRNGFVAALATELLVLHATPGGRLDTFIHRLAETGHAVMPPVPPPTTR